MTVVMKFKRMHVYDVGGILELIGSTIFVFYGKQRLTRKVSLFYFLKCMYLDLFTATVSQERKL